MKRIRSKPLLAGLLVSSSLAFGAGTASAQSVDFVPVVDESGSMGGEQAFLDDFIPALDMQLTNLGRTNNRYGLVGYGSGAPEPRKFSVGGSDLGTVQDFLAARPNLEISGGFEDGYAALDFAVDNIAYRAGSNRFLMLVTDEDRDICTTANCNGVDATGIDFNAIQNTLVAAQTPLFAILDQQIFQAGTNQQIRAVATDGQDVYIADGQGGFTKVAGVEFGNASGQTRTEYTDLVLGVRAQVGSGCVADLDLLRTGGLVAQSFAAALADCVGTGIIITPPTGGGIAAVTPYQKAVLYGISEAGGAQGELQALIAEIRGLGSAAAQQDALEQAGVHFLDAIADAGTAIMSSNFNNLFFRLTGRRDGPDREMGPSSGVTAFQGSLSGGSNALGFSDDSAIRFPDASVSNMVGLASVVQTAQASGDSDTIPLFASGKLLGFVSGSVDFGDRDASQNDAGYDYVYGSLTAGVDYALWSGGLVGLSFTYTRFDADIDQNRGTVDADAYTGSIYGSATFLDYGYVDAAASYSFVEYDYERNVTVGGTTLQANADPDGVEWGGIVRAGYDFPVSDFDGGQKSRVGPFAQLRYVDSEVDAYTETGAGTASLRVDEQHSHSLASQLGVRALTEVETAWGPIIPRVSLSWEHEFFDEGRFTRANFVGAPAGIFEIPTDEDDEDYFLANFGISGQLNPDLTVAADYTTLFGHDDLENHQIMLRARFLFGGPY